MKEHSEKVWLKNRQESLNKKFGLNWDFQTTNKYLGGMSDKTKQQVLEKIQQAEQFLREEENTKAPEVVDEIEKLKTLIRKMKRCQNCDNFDYTENKCKIGWCDNFEKWVLKEVVFIDLKELDDNGL